MSFKKTTLKNGLRIITIPQKNTQTVTVLVLVGTGSKYEKKEINGISHFLEHMYFKGTKKRPSPTAIAETLDKIGGIYNAFTSEEYTGYFAKVAISHFELALDWVSDIFLNSILPSEEIEKERGVIIEEINMISDNPMSYVQILWSKLLYGDQPAGWPITGAKDNIAKISRQDLLNYRKKQYTAKNTLISIAGNIDSNKILNRVKKYLLKINTSEPSTKEKVIDASIESSLNFNKIKMIEKQNRPQYLLHFRKTDQTHLCLGVRGLNLFHPQRYTQDLLAMILGGMMSSRLFNEIRTKLGLAYYVSTEASSDPDTGYLVTSVGVDNNKVDLAILTILKEYKKISQRKVSNSELKKAKENIKGKIALLLEPSDAQASFYGFQELLEKKIYTPEEIFVKIDKITVNDIQKVAKDIFLPERLNLALIGPFEDKGKFQSLLANLN